MSGFRHAPACVRAVFAALHLRHPQTAALAGAPETEWRAALDYCDRAQLTLALSRSGVAMPPAAARRIAGNIRDNHVRFERVLAAYREAAGAWNAAGASFLVLKGFTQAPEFVPAPRDRAQYDLDVYCPPEAIGAARDALLSLGYAPVEGFDRLPLDHLPAMLRPTGWQWSGDYFDPDIPVSIELHFRLWDEAAERLYPRGLDEFWERRIAREMDGLRFTALDRADALGYASLHALRHLLRGDLRAGHVYELAYFLHARSRDLEFWRAWQRTHHPSLRALQAVPFRLAQLWFGCLLSSEAQAEVDGLPESVSGWFEVYGFAPVDAAFRPNKDELWLHLALARSAGDRVRVLRRKLFPLNLPGGPARRASGRSPYLKLLAARIGHHARALVPALWSGLRLWRRLKHKRSRIAVTSLR